MTNSATQPLSSKWRIIEMPNLPPEPLNRPIESPVRPQDDRGTQPIALVTGFSTAC